MLDEIDDRGPPVWVARRRHDARGLVQENVRDRLRHEEPPVEIDDVALLDERVQPRVHAVDAHAARLDQLICPAPRGDSGAREIGVQAHVPSYMLTARSASVDGTK